MRGDLVEAGKAAAVAVVTGRIDALTDSLHDRAESLRDPAAAAAGAGEAARGVAGGAPATVRPDAGRRRRDEDRAEPEDSGEPDYAEPEDDEDWADEDQADDEVADDDKVAERRPTPARRGRSRGRAPVTRTRR